jgi:hypothetical protein
LGVGRGKVGKVWIGKLVWLLITVSVNFRRGRRMVGMGKSLEGILVIAVLGRGLRRGVRGGRGF